MDVRTQYITNISWNVNGLRTRNKLLRTFSVLKNLGFPEIICLQETHSNDYWASKYKNTFFNYHTFTANGTNKSCGVVLLVKKTLMFHVQQKLIDAHGRYILLKGLLNCNQFTFGSIYAPTIVFDRKNFFDKLIRIDFGVNHLILGDYNSVGSHNLDRSNDRIDHVGNSEFIDLLNYSDSVDVWRHFHPTKKEYTYSRHRTNGPFSRLDFALITKNLVSHVKKAEIISDFRMSDHKLLSIQLNIGVRMIGLDFKKIKSHIFKSTEFIAKFNVLWSEILTQFKNKIQNKINDGILDQDYIQGIFGDNLDFSNNILLQHLDLDKFWWEDFKSKVIKLGFNVQKTEVRKIDCDIRNLTRQLEKANNQTLRNSIDRNLCNLMQTLSHKTWKDDENYYRFKHERCNKDFLKIFSAERKPVYIGDIENDNNEILVNHEQKCDYLVEKYKQLYNMDFPITNDPNRWGPYYFFANLVPTVPENIQQKTGKITLDELKASVKKAHKNKCPGLDGLPVEFYKENIKTIGLVMTQVFNNIYETGDIPESWKLSLIKCIPKKSDMLTFKTLRPLQLMPDDEKTYSDILCVRVNPSLPFIINDFQSGGISGRNVSASILLVHLIVSYNSIIKDDGFVFSIDNRKAFDLINREFLFFALKIYGIHENLVNAIEALYKDNFSKISVNGYFTEVFSVTNGVKQGDPLAAVLYVCVVEALVRAVHYEESLRFLVLPNQLTLKTIQHMDDLSFFIKNKQSIINIIEIIEAFNVVSGAELNYDKSKIISIGYTGDPYTIERIPVLGGDETHKVLGVILGPIVEKYIWINWKERIKILRETIDLWHKEEISLIGRALILNIKILSKISYLLNIIEIPNIFVLEINGLMKKFLTKGSSNISLNTLNLLEEHGGINVQHLLDRAASLKLMYMKACYKPVTQDSEPLPVVTQYIAVMLRYFLNQSLVTSHQVQMNDYGDNFDGNFGAEMIHQLKPKYLFFPQMLVFLKQFLTLSLENDVCSLDTTKYYNLLRSKAINNIQFDLYNSDSEEKKKCFENIFSAAQDNKVKSFNYVLAIDSVNTLSKFRRGRESWCVFCTTKLGIMQQVESKDHIFITCSIALHVWNKIRDTFNSLNLPAYGHSMHNGVLGPDRRKILYKLNSSKEEAYFISEVIHILWVNRCISVKQNVHNDHRAVICHLKAKLQMMIRIDHRSLTQVKYNKRWGMLKQFADRL